jgi:hypothetical protein
VKPEFMTWEIEYPTPKGLHHLGEVKKQFILWHKKDIVLNVSSPTMSHVHLEGAIEDGEVYSPNDDGDDGHGLEMPHSSQVLATTELTRHILLHLVRLSKGMMRCLNVLHLVRSSKGMMTCLNVL